MRDREARHPHDFVVRIDDECHAIAVVTRHFAIDKNVLQLSTARRAQRTKTIARAPVSHEQGQPNRLHLHGRGARSERAPFDRGRSARRRNHDGGFRHRNRGRQIEGHHALHAVAVDERAVSAAVLKEQAFADRVDDPVAL